MKKLLLILLSLLFCMSCLASCTGTSDEQDGESVGSIQESTEAPTETEEVSTAPEDAAAMELVDFIVSVPADRQAVILQLTDTQIIDASQCRTPDRLGSSQKEIWGADKKYIGKFFTLCIEKGEKGGRKLTAQAGRGGLFIALLLFVGIPLPGTGAWTGTLAASLLNMGWKSTTGAVSLGVILAGIIMATVSSLGLHIFGL